MRPRFLGSSCFTLLLGATFFAPLSGQTGSPGDTVVLTPSTKYGLSGLMMPISGEGYRDLWATPIRVPVLDFKTLGGGQLQVLRRGGGFMSQTLHLADPQGRRYVLRTVDKFPAQSLPDELQESIVSDVLQGAVAKLHPSAALVADPILTAAGILHPSPTFYQVPDDPFLGEHRETFAGKLVLFEERPDEGQDDTAGFAGSMAIKNTANFKDDLEEDSRNRLDTQEFLRARLVDLVLGDRDRSVNNWLWARFDAPDGGFLWRPVPRDRDQVFVDYDGAISWVTRLIDPRMVTFGEDLDAVVGLTRNAWDVDRPFLVGLSHEDWDEAVQDIQARLSDSVIGAAVRALPASHWEAAGPQLAQDLKSRRDQLPAAAADFFDIVNRSADIIRTDDDEFAHIRRLADGSTEVTVFLRDGDNPSATGPVLFQRTFSPGETKEVRLYLKGGEDFVVLEGAARSNIRVRVMGGGGTDDIEIRDQVQPGLISFYDDDDTDRVVDPNGVALRGRRPQPPSYWPGDGTGPGTPDWGGVWYPMALGGYSSSKGFVFGVGAQRFGYGFEQNPYRYRLATRVGFATGPSKPIVRVDYEVQNIGRHLYLIGGLHHSPIVVNSYYGFGNETTDDEAKDFYRPSVVTTDVVAALRFMPKPSFQLELGADARWSNSDTTDVASLLSSEGPYGSGKFGGIGLVGGLTWDGRDLPGRPSRGALLQLRGTVNPEWFDVDQGTFGSVKGLASLTLARADNPFPQAAFRIGGKKTFGDYPWFRGAFLGGDESVRGLRDERYLGDAAVFGSAEGRAELFGASVIVPLKFGGLAFVDTGRVFLEDEDSNKWHTGVGFGLWVAPDISEYPQVKDLRIIVSMGFSEGDNKFYFGLEQAF